MVEQVICNHWVGGSIPLVSFHAGGVLERSKRADCKSVGYAYGGSNPSAPIRFYAGVAQLVEHWPSKPCVAGSNPVSRLCKVNICRRSSVGRARPW